MARDAPFHLQCVLLKDRRHIVDLPVTGRTADALCYMNAVVKVGELGKVVHAFPLDRLIVTKARSHRLEIRAVVPDLAVAVHAGLCRRHAGRGRGFNGLVTISTVDAVVPRVMFMTELNGLLLFEVTPRDIRGPGNLRVDQKCRRAKNSHRHHADPGYIVCTFVKELSHLQAFLQTLLNFNT